MFKRYLFALCKEGGDSLWEFCQADFMKKNKILKNLEELFGKIEMFSETVINDFHKERIHRLRVNIKKLRACLRLLNMGTNDSKVLRIPRSLKKFYRRAGNIRNIQNHRAWIYQFFRGRQRPAGYLAFLRKKIYEEKIEMKDASLSSSLFRHEWNKIENRLPDKINSDTIAAFMDQKKSIIRIILSSEKTDEMLHSLRKQLKDIQYNEKLIRYFMGPDRPPVMENIKKLTELLGNHQDYVIHLGFLESNDIEKLSTEERKLLDTATAEINKNKTALRNQILLMIAK